MFKRIINNNSIYGTMVKPNQLNFIKKVDKIVVIKLKEIISSADDVKVRNNGDGGYRIDCSNGDELRIKYVSDQQVFLIEVLCMGERLAADVIAKVLNESRFIKELDLALGLKLCHWEW